MCDCKPVTVPTEPTEVIDKMIAESEAHMSILRHLRNLAEFTKDIPEMLDAFHQVILPGLRRIR